MMTLVDKSDLSRSTEDYLKAIYKLGSDTQPAQTTAIAQELSVAPPSVSGMIKRLSEAGLVRHVPYHGVQLTDVGHRAALRMIRRHRILETYLTTKLGYSWDTVHEEAERLEHAVSDALIERMAIALGNPQFDPHGAPIPSERGEVEDLVIVSLTEIPVGRRAELTMVSDDDPERLRFVESLGLKPGVRFSVLKRQPFHGPVTIRVEGQEEEAIIGFELAGSLACSFVGGETA